MRYLLIFLFLAGSLLAQNEESKTCPKPDNKKALDFYEKGTDKKKYKKPERLQFLQKAIQLEPGFAEANFALAQEIIVKCKLDDSPFAPAVPFLLAAVESCPEIHSEPYYYLGFHYYEQMKNDSAIFWLKKFLNFKSDDEAKFAKGEMYDAEIYQAKAMINSAKKEAELAKKTVPFDPKVVQGVSTENSEYLPIISPDNTMFLYTRAQPDQSIDRVYATDKEKEVFTYSKRNKEGNWDSGKPMEFPFNQQKNEGGATLTIDNNHLYYAQTRFEGGSSPNTDIYYTDFSYGSWAEIKKVPVINHPIYWDSQPTVSSDGNTIIFVSDRPGGYGKLDLYITTRDPRNRMWTAPVNLGPKINTPGNEKTPFLHSDFETLYFSSDGHYGFGGMDIFFTRKDDKGKWKEPENIGSPINGENDDAGFFVSTDGKYGYFCSLNEGKVRGKGVGKYDIYQFDLYMEARPQEVAFVKGEIKKTDEEPLENFKVELKNTVTKEKITAVVDSTTGQYMAAVNLKSKADYIVTANAKGHAFTSTSIKTTETNFEKPPVVETMEIKKAEKGKTFLINNIYYATGAADLYPESFVVLEEFAEFMKEHPEMKIEIQGHTDNIGNQADNIALSEKRAKNVMTYLISKGVNEDKVSAKGYGPTKPIADNTLLEGRAKNRRTEFLILEN